MAVKVRVKSRSSSQAVAQGQSPSYISLASDIEPPPLRPTLSGSPFAGGSGPSVDMPSGHLHDLSAPLVETNVLVHSPPASVTASPRVSSRPRSETVSLSDRVHGPSSLASVDQVTPQGLQALQLLSSPQVLNSLLALARGPYPTQPTVTAVWPTGEGPLAGSSGAVLGSQGPRGPGTDAVRMGVFPPVSDSAMSAPPPDWELGPDMRSVHSSVAGSFDPALHEEDACSHRDQEASAKLANFWPEVLADVRDNFPEAIQADSAHVGRQRFSYAAQALNLGQEQCEALRVRESPAVRGELASALAPLRGSVGPPALDDPNVVPSFPAALRRGSFPKLPAPAWGPDKLVAPVVLPKSRLPLTQDDLALFKHVNPSTPKAISFTDSEFAKLESATVSALQWASMADAALGACMRVVFEDDSTSFREDADPATVRRLLQAAAIASDEQVKVLANRYLSLVLARRDALLSSPGRVDLPDQLVNSLRVGPLTPTSLFGPYLPKAVAQQAERARAFQMPSSGQSRLSAPSRGRRFAPYQTSSARRGRPSATTSRAEAQRPSQPRPPARGRGRGGHAPKTQTSAGPQ